MSLPKYQTAIVASDTATATSLTHSLLKISNASPLPSLDPDTILLRTSAVALNPVDTKTRRPPFASPGCVSGTDCAGVVVAKGPAAVTAAPISIGDRVFGVVHGMHVLEPANGAFAHYAALAGHIVLKVPEHLSTEEAASMGTAITTVGLALFRSLEVPGYPDHPVDKKTCILIYGASTATGTMAIQFAKLCGLTVLATCSPKNHEMVKSYGAHFVYDYHPSAAADSIAAIKKQSGNALKMVLDCVSEGSTMEFCYNCIGRTGGRYTRLEPYAEGLHTRPNVKPDWILAPAAVGKPIGWPAPFARDADPETKDWAKGYFVTVQGLLDRKLLRPHPLQIKDGGFEAVLEGLEILEKRQLSGQKIVVRLPQN